MKFYNPLKPHFIKVGEKYAVRKFVPFPVYLDIRYPSDFIRTSDITTSTWAKSVTLEEAREALKKYNELLAKLKADRKVTVL